MTMLDTIQTLSGGPLGYGALIGAVALLIRSTATALEKRAEAKRLKAAAEKVAADDDAVTNAQLRAWIDELREEVGELRKQNQACEERSRRLAGELAELRRMFNGTPQPMAKVTSLVVAREDGAPKRATGDER